MENATMENATLAHIAAALPNFRSDLFALRKELAGIKNEAQTRLLIFDFMRSALGFETREAELEHDINGWKADIAIQPGSKSARVTRPTLIVECKCVTVALMPRHADQAARYARSENIRWAVLTNGLEWYFFSVPKAGKDAKHVCIAHFDLDSASPSEAAAFLYAISRDGLNGDALDALAERKARFNKYVCAQLLLEPEVAARLLRRFADLGVDGIDANAVVGMIREVLDPDATTDSKEGVKSAKRLLAKCPPPAKTKMPRPAPSASCAADARPAASDPSAANFTFTAKGVTARCRRTADGFMVFASQAIVPAITPSAVGTSIEKTRGQLMSDGVIVDGKFARDHVFSTASGAASCILGSPVNGNAVWKPV